MLVVCNGAVKSGSTWLFNILNHLVDFSCPPKKYLTNKTKKHPCICPDMFKEFLENEDYKKSNYISKNHLNKREHKDLLLKNSEVFVFDIERDVRDVVVSSFYHDCFRNGYRGDFDDYYWDMGRELAATLAAYHDLWRTPESCIYMSSYEKLQSEFVAEVARIAAHLGVTLEQAKIESIRKGTSIGALRKNYGNDSRFQGQKFFRKGIVGDWENHFDQEKLKDIENIQKRGLGRLDRHRIVSCARKLFRRNSGESA